MKKSIKELTKENKSLRKALRRLNELFFQHHIHALERYTIEAKQASDRFDATILKIRKGPR